MGDNCGCNNVANANCGCDNGYNNGCDICNNSKFLFFILIFILLVIGN